MIKCIILDYTTAVQRIACVSKFCIYNCNMFFNSKILIANDNKHHYDCKVQSYIYIYICDFRSYIYVIMIKY